MFARDHDLSAAIVRSVLYYDPLSGVFTWLPRKIKRGCNAHMTGKRAGRVGTNGYRDICIFGRRFREHRLAWLLMTNSMPREEIDHINGEKTDNRWSNLRAATRIQNMHNRGIRSTNTSGFKGVTWSKSKSKWVAQIVSNGKFHFLGHFLTKEKAHSAYQSASERLHREFARAA